MLLCANAFTGAVFQEDETRDSDDFEPAVLTEAEVAEQKQRLVKALTDKGLQNARQVVDSIQFGRSKRSTTGKGINWDMRHDNHTQSRRAMRSIPEVVRVFCN